MSFLRSASILIVVAGLATAAIADSDVVKTVKSYYAKEAVLFKKKDAASIKKLIFDTTTPDFVAIAPDSHGKILRLSRDQITLNLANAFSKVVDINLSTPTVAIIRADSKNAVVSALATTYTTAKGPDKKDHKIVLYVKKEETWAKVGGAWKLKITRQLSVRRTIDGQAR